MISEYEVRPEPRAEFEKGEKGEGVMRFSSGLSVGYVRPPHARTVLRLARGPEGAQGIAHGRLPSEAIDINPCQRD